MVSCIFWHYSLASVTYIPFCYYKACFQVIKVWCSHFQVVIFTDKRCMSRSILWLQILTLALTVTPTQDGKWYSLSPSHAQDRTPGCGVQMCPLFQRVRNTSCHGLASPKAITPWDWMRRSEQQQVRVVYLLCQYFIVNRSGTWLYRCAPNHIRAVYVHWQLLPLTLNRNIVLLI